MDGWVGGVRAYHTGLNSSALKKNSAEGVERLIQPEIEIMEA